MAAELREAGRRAAARPAVEGAPAENRVRGGPRCRRRAAAGGRRRAGGRSRGRRPQCRPADRVGRHAPDADRAPQVEHPRDRDQPRRDEGGGARGPRAVEGAASGGGPAPRAGRRPRRRDARPLVALVPGPGQPHPRPGGRPPAAGAARPGLRPVGGLRMARPERSAGARAARKKPAGWRAGQPFRFRSRKSSRSRTPRSPRAGRSGSPRATCPGASA